MNTQLLKSYIMKHDRTQENLAKAMGISLSNLNAKINGHGTEFSQSEISFITVRYNLSNKEIRDIFFAN